MGSGADRGAAGRAEPDFGGFKGGGGGGGESLVSVSVCRREPVWFLIGSPREETLLVIES